MFAVDGHFPSARLISTCSAQRAYAIWRVCARRSVTYPLSSSNSMNENKNLCAICRPKMDGPDSRQIGIAVSTTLPAVTLSSVSGY